MAVAIADARGLSGVGEARERVAAVQMWPACAVLVLYAELGTGLQVCRVAAEQHEELRDHWSFEIDLVAHVREQLHSRVWYRSPNHVQCCKHSHLGEAGHRGVVALAAGTRALAPCTYRIVQHQLHFNRGTRAVPRLSDLAACEPACVAPVRDETRGVCMVRAWASRNRKRESLLDVLALRAAIGGRDGGS